MLLSAIPSTLISPAVNQVVLRAAEHICRALQQKRRTKPAVCRALQQKRWTKPLQSAASAIPIWNSTLISPAVNQEKENHGDKRQWANPQQQQQLKFLQKMAPPLIAAFVALSPITTPPVSYAEAMEVQRGTSLFGHACIGCHDAGGNIIQPGTTLFLKDLQRNRVDTEEEIYRITYYGKGRMPGFGEMCTPRGQCTFGARLKDDEIRLLADFVKSQADQGWLNIGNNGD